MSYASRYAIGGVPFALFLFSLRHGSLDVEAQHGGLAVGANGDGLLEMTGETTTTVIGNGEGPLLAGLYGGLGVLRYRASAAGHGLIDHQRLVAGIGEGESALLHIIGLRERAEVVGGLVKLDLGLCLGEGDAAYKHHQCEQNLFHLIPYLLLHTQQVLFSFLMGAEMVAPPAYNDCNETKVQKVSEAISFLRIFNRLLPYKRPLDGPNASEKG